MKMVLLPLDERPCNYFYPTYLPLSKEITLVMPPRSILSKKKVVADIEKIHEWLINECKDADYALLSLDTLLYGGIVPSRLHHDSLDTLINRSKTIKRIKEVNPNIKIFVNELIMRTPSYSNSTEEPDYFDEYGKELWEYGTLLDKKHLGIITLNELTKMNELLDFIPHEYIKDLMNRRDINKKATINNLRYLLDNSIDYFIIPQDDCAPYGFTSIDRREINDFLTFNKLNDKVITYPGADEAGMVLISYALNDYYQKELKVYVKYVDESLKERIPDYEDRPLDKSISEHIFISKMKRTYDYDESDLVLLINLYSENDLEETMEFIKQVKNDKKIIGIADVLTTNRGDIKLFKALNSHKLLNKIDSYAGWNTSSNTMGTTISNMVSYYYSRDDKKKGYSLLIRYLEDVFYMGIIRDELNKMIYKKASLMNISIEQVNDYKETLIDICEIKLNEYANTYDLKEVYNYNHFEVDFPWNRTFETELIIK